MTTKEQAKLDEHLSFFYTNYLEYLKICRKNFWPKPTFADYLAFIAEDYELRLLELERTR